MNTNTFSNADNDSLLRIALSALFLIPLLLFFILNPVHADIATHRSMLNYFWLVYLSLAAGVVIFFSALLTGKVKLDGVLVCFLLIFFITLISTLVFQTFPEQGILKKTAQLCTVAVACVCAYVVGGSFPKSAMLVRSVTLMIGVGVITQLLLISKSAYFYYLRPYGWSNYMLPFFLYWIAVIDKSAPLFMRASFCAVIIFAVIVSGTRTLLIWALFCLLVAKPAKIPVRLLLAALFGGLGFLVYGSVASNEGVLSLISRYQDFLADNRSVLWIQAMDLFKELNLFLGGGYFSYTTYKLFDVEISSAHNTYITLLLQSGILGLLPGLILLFIVIKRYWRIAPGIVLFLPVVGVIGELPLYPYTYTRVFENMVLYFLIGTLAARISTKNQLKGNAVSVSASPSYKFNFA